MKSKPYHFGATLTPAIVWTPSESRLVPARQELCHENSRTVDVTGTLVGCRAPEAGLCQRHINERQLLAVMVVDDVVVLDLYADNSTGMEIVQTVQQVVKDALKGRGEGFACIADSVRVGLQQPGKLHKRVGKLPA